MRVLDLFSGIGGFSLGLERAGMQTVAFCEIEEFPRRVLAKHWPTVPIHHDVRELKAEDVGAVDVICGGYPCQPFSLAGKRGGTEDDRHLWPEMRRLVDELRPSWVIGENVAGHISMGLDAVLSDLGSLGYACRPFVIPALAVGASHQRNRIWIVAHADRDGHSPDDGLGEGGGSAPAHQGSGHQRQRVRPKFGRVGEALADANVTGPQGRDSEVLRERSAERPLGPRGASISDADSEQTRRPTEPRSECGEWLPEPDVGRVAHGVSSRVDRLRGLGNAVVPQIPEIIGRAILAAEGINS